MTPVDRHTLLHNHAIQNLTQHVQALDDGFESVYKIKGKLNVNNIVTHLVIL